LTVASVTQAWSIVLNGSAEFSDLRPIGITPHPLADAQALVIGIFYG
jgi:hypothetical protein